VRWEVAAEPRFRRLVASGSVMTGPARDHTVKVDATGLRPATTYFYRFVLDGVRSRTGRTRTAPASDADVRRMRFGVVSCANLQAGWFSAYRHLARRDDIDAVLHLGDYLYEYAPGEYGMGNSNVDVRRHQPAREIVSLADYRQRHAQYKRDPDLGELHASAPFIVTWDDHESANDAWRHGAQNHDPATEGDFERRRAAAHRAYDEWMPVRLSGSTALHDGRRIYRRLRFGRLAELSMLDLRTYRSQQVGNDLEAADDPRRTITGHRQGDWLERGLAGTDAQWKLVGNPVMIAPVLVPPLPAEVTAAITGTMGPVPADGAPYNVDQWDGYQADRRRLLSFLDDRGIKDTVFLTGDIHSAWACDVPRDAGQYPVDSNSVATELVCSSVTSNNLDDILGAEPRTASLAVEAAVQTGNQHVRYLDFDRHGYSVLDVTPARVQMDWYVIGDRADRRTGAEHSASWRVDAGTQHVRPAQRPVGS
jgi:alkaline phosphatase D